MAPPTPLRRALGALVLGALLAGACSGGGSDDAATGDSAGDGAAGATATTAAASAEDTFPDPDWATADPADHGLDPDGLAALEEHLEEAGSNCMAVIKDGVLVHEQYWNGYDAETEQEIFSASKSVSSTLIGIAQDLGHLDIDQKASDVITEWKGTPSEDVTIRNLLSNDSGRYYDFQTDYFRMTGAPNRTEFAIALEQQHPIGEHWEYNNSAIQVLQAVLERSTGEDMTAFAEEHLFGPLGMASEYSTDQSGTEPTFMGVQSTCRDMARFGYLFLRQGEWAGEQVVSAEWVAEATSPSQDLNRAYGFLWWLNEEGWLLPVAGGTGEGLFWPDAPEDAYAALGLGDQIVLVLPSQDMVVTRTGPWRSEDRPVESTNVNDVARLAVAAAEGG